MSLDRSTLFIGGSWAAPAGTETIEVVSPHSEELVATVPAGHHADIDAAVAAARLAFDEGPWPRTSPEERIEVVQNFANLYAGRMEEMGHLITTEMGSPASFSQLAQAPAPWMMIEAFLTVARAFPWEETRPGALGTDVIVRREPVGVVAAIPPWNVPQFTTISKVVPALLAGCTVVRQAGAGDAARLLPDGRAARRGRRARGRRQHRGRWPGGRRAPRGAPRHRQGRLHRLDRGRSADRRRVRRAAQAGQPRARRQVRRDRPRRRRPRRDHGGPEVHRPDEQRPGLRRADPHPGQPRAVRRGGRRARRDRRGHGRGRPGRPRDRGRADGRAPPAGARGEVHRARPGGGRPPRRRRTRHAARASTAAGTSDPRSSPTSTTGCASPRRRSSVRCSR